MFLEYGTGPKAQIFDISSYKPTFENMPKALPGLHALSGCDSTSGFNGIGKVKCLKVPESDDRFIDLLGEEATLSATVLEVLEEYVCKLYGVKNETDINRARYKLFTNRTKLPEPQKLPPTKDALILHLKRVNFQTPEWKSALVAQTEYRDPAENGWKRTAENTLKIQWTEKEPALESLLVFVSCSCKNSKCATRACRCRKVQLHCSDLCDCLNCDNRADDVESEVSDESSSSDSSDSDYEN